MAGSCSHDVAGEQNCSRADNVAYAIVQSTGIQSALSHVPLAINAIKAYPAHGMSSV